MRDFRGLTVWEKGHALALAVYKQTSTFPRAEQYGLTSQIQRAAVSVPANIAEGCGRDGDGELAQFLQIAMGSASELEYHLLLAHDLELIPDTEYQQLNDSTTEVKRMLASFIQRLRSQKNGTRRKGHSPSRPETDTRPPISDSER